MAYRNDRDRSRDAQHRRGHLPQRSRRGPLRAARTHPRGPSRRHPAAAVDHLTRRTRGRRSLPDHPRPPRPGPRWSRRVTTTVDTPADIAHAAGARRRRARLNVPAWLPILAAGVVVVGLWKAIVVVGAYPVFVLPAPEVVAMRLGRAWQDGLIQPELAATLTEIALGFLAGATVA